MVADSSQKWFTLLPVLFSSKARYTQYRTAIPLTIPGTLALTTAIPGGSENLTESAGDAPPPSHSETDSDSDLGLYSNVDEAYCNLRDW